jgi:hypothetical protein
MDIREPKILEQIPYRVGPVIQNNPLHPMLGIPLSLITCNKLGDEFTAIIGWGNHRNKRMIRCLLL